MTTKVYINTKLYKDLVNLLPVILLLKFYLIDSHYCSHHVLRNYVLKTQG